MHLLPKNPKNMHLYKKWSKYTFAYANALTNRSLDIT